MYKALLVEDDEDIREIICDYFDEKSKGYITVDFAADGDTALVKAYENNYDLLILDIMLPTLDGFSICKEVRRESDVPIIFITARSGNEDMLKGYALGCDDYIIKPFSIPAFFQKADALIRRSKGLIRANTLVAGNIELNPNNGKVTRNGTAVNLTAKEYSILKILLENKGKVVLRTSLTDLVWGYNNNTSDRVLDSHIKNLRKALGEDSDLIKTVIGRGYKIDE